MKTMSGVAFRNRSSKTILILMLFIGLLWCATSWAQVVPEPFVSTDRNDYSPGDVVAITGVNFQPGESVTIAVQAPGRNDRFVTSVADKSGSFTNTDFSPGEGDRQAFFKIVATGDLSGPDLAAVNYFYDSAGVGPCPYTVDASIAASIPASGLFKTIQEAVTGLPNPGPCTINIKAAAGGTTYSEAVVIDSVNSGVTVTVSVTFLSASHTIHRASGSFLTAGFAIGQMITTTNVSNPGPFTITNVTALDITVSENLTNVTPAVSTTITTPVSSPNEIVIQADPANIGAVIVTAPGPASNGTTSHAFSLNGSKFLTITGLTVSNSGRSAIRVRGDLNPRNSDITIVGNTILNNNASGASAVNAIDIGNLNMQTWVVNNLIRNNGRYGVAVDSGSGPSYVVNNTISGNIWGGVQRGASATLNLVNNLVVGNGTAAGGTGNCECGLGQASSGTTTSITLTNNMFYRNGNTTSGFTDIENPSKVLDATDSGNYVTCTGTGTGCTITTLGGVAGCTFSDCLGTHTVSTEIFVSASDFHLKTTSPISPAIDKGIDSFISGSLEWVPDIDFFGNARPLDGDGDGTATTDIGYHEAAASIQNTTTSVTSHPQTSIYGNSVTFTATVMAGANPVTSGSVSFYDGTTCGGTQIGTAQNLDTNGQASVSTSTLSVPSHPITACYSGATGFNASNGNVTQTVNKATPVITWANPADITYRLRWAPRNSMRQRMWQGCSLIPRRQARY